MPHRLTIQKVTNPLPTSNYSKIFPCVKLFTFKCDYIIITITINCLISAIIGQYRSCLSNCIPANSHTLAVSLTPAGWKLRSHAGSRLRANFSCPRTPLATPACLSWPFGLATALHCIIIVDLLTHHPRHLHLVGQRKLQCRKKVDFRHLYECIGYSRTPVIECGITPTPSKLKARPISGVHPKFIHFCLIKSNLDNSNSPLTWTKCPLLWSPLLVV